MNFKLCVFVHQFNRIGLILVFLFCCNHLFAQEWYKNLKKEHNQYRFGIGIQATEPTGLMINVFKGTFCSGENAFETSLIWEAFLGFENVFLDKKMDFEGARWGKGGIQGGVNVLRSLFAYEGGNFSYQLMPGIGLQFGERKYNVLNETVTDGTSGINLILRSGTRQCR